MSPIMRRSLFIVFLILSILACNLPIFSPNANPGFASTAAAQTVAAVMSQAVADTPVPSVTPIPSLAPLETFTPLPTFSPAPNFTATSNVPLISVSIATNCRVGPGKAYEQVGALLVGVKTEIIARSPDGNYWYIRNPDKASSYCWVWGEYATVEGDAAALPIFTPPPSPTPVPEFLVAYIAADSCVGWWSEFLIKNTGSQPFESVSITIKDTVTGVSLTSTSDDFTNIDGCLTSTTVTKLKPGDAFTLSSPAFTADPQNHKVKASITLCTKDGLGGECVTNSLTFKSK